MILDCLKNLHCRVSTKEMNGKALCLSPFNDKSSLPFLSSPIMHTTRHGFTPARSPSMRMTRQSATCYTSQSAGMMNDNQELRAAGPVRENSDRRYDGVATPKHVEGSQQVQSRRSSATD